MTNFNTEFLTKEQELTLKNEFITFKNQNKIDTEILDDLIKLNSLVGFATIWSCIGHDIDDDSYIVFKFDETLTYPITEALYSLDRLSHITIDWDDKCGYDIDGVCVEITNVVTVRSSERYNMFEDLVFELID